ncbi:MAG: hypothetical protein A2864_02035 [Candidatus Woykebacteria bacterium RIFCSPHIGHO2_01_FULL_39_12]|uniref:Transposase IS200-like domain-containing protein n=2 Tax=Candidatus Woykeibacteriota TaxID=1817899 RepID=A0A1G1WBP8_9BACT|nr:MAG: hypothetical protein A2134_02000 [Candidatus Woykebacteria bacterium RBG_16_39_9b]OGY27317.1 MAG: hypothetical protein A2864_02035 [Candidatus Woykebacteria bacterium RIFCSPHIGHO2_01_FULL_39_12]
MPAREPIFYKGGYYHIYSRGIEKRTIFQDDADYRRFLNKVKLYGDKYKISVLVYCLMPNHYHLLINQKTDLIVSLFIQRLNLAYSMYFNKRYERVGPLFQGRFKAKLIQTDDYLLHLSRYIHLNPRELLTGRKTLASYTWSSYPAYVGLRKNDDLTEDKIILDYFSKKDTREDYRKFAEGEEEFPNELAGLILE